MFAKFRPLFVVCVGGIWLLKRDPLPSLGALFGGVGGQDDTLCVAYSEDAARIDPYSSLRPWYCQDVFATFAQQVDSRLHEIQNKL